MNGDKIKIPVELKHLFNQEYFDLDLAQKILLSESKEMKEFLSKLMPLVKSYLEKEFPLVKMLNIF